MDLLSIIKYNLFSVMLFFCLTAPLAGKSWDYYYEKGKLQYKTEMYDYARYNLEKALDLNPSLYQAAALLGHIHRIQNRKLRAIELYERSLSINGRQPDLHVTAGRLYDFYIERKKAMQHYRAAVAIEPSHIQANLFLAGHYFRQGMREQAYRHFRASEKASESPASGYIKKAEDAEKKGDKASALILYAQAIEAGPALVSARMGPCRIYRSTGDYLKAVRCLENLKQDRPDYVRAYIILGHIYFNRRLPGKKITHINLAVKNLRQALEINPSEQEALLKLAEIYEYLGRDSESRELLEKASSAESPSLK